MKKMQSAAIQSANRWVFAGIHPARWLFVHSGAFLLVTFFSGFDYLSRICTKYTSSEAVLELLHRYRHFTRKEGEILRRIFNNCRANCINANIIF